jgi:hypothetical protein
MRTISALSLAQVPERISPAYTVQYVYWRGPNPEFYDYSMETFPAIPSAPLSTENTTPIEDN